MQQSFDHHYLPIFYLKRWRQPNGKLYEFSQPYNELAIKEVSPKGTGFDHRLYEMAGVSKEFSQQIEDHFMRIVDTKAAEALQIIEQNFDKINHDIKVRSSWSCFIMSLLMRHPEDVKSLKTAVSKEWAKEMPAIEAKFASKLSSTNSVAGFLKSNDPQYSERMAMGLFPSLIDHALIGTLLNSFHWSVRKNKNHELITSDRPVLLTATLTEKDAYVLLPIGPNSLFIAVKERSTANVIHNQEEARIVGTVNEQICKHAVKYVYSNSRKENKFIQEFISKSPQLSLFEQLARYRDLQRGSKT